MEINNEGETDLQFSANYIAEGTKYQANHLQKTNMHTKCYTLCDGKLYPHSTYSNICTPPLLEHRK